MMAAGLTHWKNTINFKCDVSAMEQPALNNDTKKIIHKYNQTK